MTENQKNKEDGWVLLGTKVPPHIGQLFDLLAKQRGMASYELLQLLVNGFITAAKHDGPLTPKLRLLIDSLKLDVAFNKAFNFASPTAQNEIAQMVLILQQPEHKGFGMVMIDRPFMGEATVTYCVDSIIERVAEVGMNEIYKDLRQVGVELETKSVRETLVLMVDDQKFANLKEMDDAEMPGMDNFHEFGKRVELGQKYKRVHHRTPDSIAQQQSIIFEDVDREVADMEVQDWEGERRQTEEPPEEMENEMGFRPHGQDW